MVSDCGILDYQVQRSQARMLKGIHGGKLGKKFYAKMN
jgi:hypothetical protein